MGAMLRSMVMMVAAGVLISCSFGHRHDSAREAPPAKVPPVPIPSPLPGGVPPPPADIMSIPDAVPRAEPRARSGNPRFYDVFGQRYYVSMSSTGYVARGVASWYGPGFHAVRTSIGEPYDMYAMTAAHKTLPLPTYVRVTSLENGRSIVVRVNDRGPFVGNRIIDLSYTAAAKLDMLRKGTAIVEVRAIDLIDVVSSPNAPATVDSKAQAPAVFGNPAAVVAPGAPAPAAPPAAGSAPAAATPSLPAAAPAPPAATARPAAFTRKPLFMQAGAFATRANAESLAAKLRSGHFGSVFIRETQTRSKTLYRVRIGPIASVPEFDRVAAALDRAGVREAQLALD